jgi:T-complex protein 1 subunit theta
MKYNIGEEKEIERLIRSIAESGVNVIITGQTIDDMAQHFIEKHGMMVIKLTSQHELRRLCRATKARPMVQLGPLAKEDIGLCSRVFVREVGSQNVVVFQQDKNDATAISTILLRASTNNILNDIERAVDDGVNVVKAMVKDGRFVAGAGAVDIELARRLTAIGAKSKGLDQYAIKKFAEAFEVVPRTLAENAGLIAVDIISQLYSAHEKNQPNAGVNIEDGGVKDMTKDGIIDLLSTKRQAIFLATDAVLTILRVDQIIQAKPAGGPKLPKKQGHWDDED